MAFIPKGSQIFDQLPSQFESFFPSEQSFADGKLASVLARAGGKGVDLLTRVHRDYAPGPIYLTENGSTFDDVVLPDGRIVDAERRSYLARHLAAAREAIARGVPLEGYFAWSLLDNFEWAEGYVRRFGLTHVDFTTQQRRLKASGEWFAQFLRR